MKGSLDHGIKTSFFLVGDTSCEHNVAANLNLDPKILNYLFLNSE